MLKNILVGSDPEFFIVKDGSAFPSFDITRGDKYEPEDVGDGFSILKDNVLLEANIPPAASEEEFVKNITHIKNFFSQLLKPAGLKLECDDSKEYDEAYLTHPEACVFGCSQYANAWERGMFSAEDMSHLKSRVAG